MAEYLAVDYDGIFNRYKQNTDYLEAPVEEYVVDVVALQTEAQLTEATSNTLSYQAVLAQQSLNNAILPEDIEPLNKHMMKRLDWHKKQKKHKRWRK